MTRIPLSTQRNKNIQRVLVEAAKLAPRQDHELALLYKREKRQETANQATLAVARKMVERTRSRLKEIDRSAAVHIGYFKPVALTTRIATRITDRPSFIRRNADGGAPLHSPVNRPVRVDQKTRTTT